jgi:hypothetical protein
MAKQSQAWKVHELQTAKYFGTSRRLRGADFSKSDVEVLVDVNEWLHGMSNTDGPHVVVECKYSSQAGIVTDFKNLTSGNVSKHPIVVLESYVLLPLNDFKEFYLDFIEKEIFALQALSKYDFIHSSKKAPEYLKAYREQSMDYTKSFEGPCLPIVSLAKNSVKGKIAIVNIDDIKRFSRQLKVCALDDLL